jgi:hypothetical protein
MLGREAWQEVLDVNTYAAFKITGDADVERTIAAAGENVDAWTLFHGWRLSDGASSDRVQHAAIVRVVKLD